MKMKKPRFIRILSIVVIGFILGFFPFPSNFASGAEYYVDVDESGALDDPGWGGASNPFKTIQYAITQLAAGDTLYVMSGTYSDSSYGIAAAQLTIPSGLAGVQIIGDDSQGATPLITYTPITTPAWMTGLEIQSSGVMVKGLIITGFPNGGIKIDGYDNIIDDCRIYDNTGTGILISGAAATNNDIINTYIYDDPSTTGFVQSKGIFIDGVGVASQIDVEGCSIENHGIYGVHLGNSGARIKRNKLVGNNSGIYVEANSGKEATPAIWNNLIHGGVSDTMAYGISIFSDAGVINSNLTIYNNTIHGANTNGIENRISAGGSSDPSIFYNIISEYAENGINNAGGTPGIGYNDVYSSTTGAIDYNGGIVGGTGAIPDNPEFLSAGTDFHLSSSSPCIDQIPSSVVSGDLDHPEEEIPPWRPQGGSKDMGCYEYSSPTSILPGTYHVDSASGNDETGDGSSLNPWQTLHHAIYKINGGSSGNYTLNVATGEYKLLSSGGFEPDAVLYITQSNLTIEGAGSGTIVDGASTSDPVWTDGLDIQGPAENVLIKDLVVMNFSANGIHMGGAKGCRVETCEIKNNFGNGICIEAGGDPFGPSSNNIISNNQIYYSGDPDYIQKTGIKIKGGSGNRISGNVIRDHGDKTGDPTIGRGIEVDGSDPVIEKNVLFDNVTGIGVSDLSDHAAPAIVNNLIYDGPASNTLWGIWIVSYNDIGSSPVIYHNTIDGGGNDGIYLREETGNGVLEAVIEFNIITNFHFGIDDINGNATLQMDFNNVWNNVTNYVNCAPGLNDINPPADPLYVDESTFDYHLQSSSPCRDAIPEPTLPPPHPVDADLDGVARPQPAGGAYDMGCYEYVPEAPPVEYYTVSFNAGTGGRISGDANQTVREGADCTQVTAVPDEGYRFTGWTGSHTGTENPLTVTNVTSDKNITANFQLDIEYQVVFTAGPGGNISGPASQTVKPGGDCASVTAIPDVGYDFIGWSGDYDGTDNPLSLIGVASDKYIFANFKIKTYELSVLPGDGGGLDGSTNQTIGHGGDSATLTAVPAIGYHFVGWTGDYVGTENPLVIANVTSDMHIVANFEINTYDVVFTAGLGGYVSGETNQIVAHGSNSTPVTAEADTGYVFSGWSGDASGAANSLTLENVISDMTVTANFSVNAPPEAPGLVSPINNAFVDPAAVALSADNYADPEGDAHVESAWQIWRAGEADPFYITSSSSDLLTHTPGTAFENGVQYEWRVGFVDAGSRLISWSGREAFIAGAAEEDDNIPSVPPGFTMKDYRLMSFVQWPGSDPFLNQVNMITSADADPADFKVGAYNPLTGGYDQYPDITIEPGRAYWILARYGMDLTLDGVFVSVDRDFILSLHYDETTGNGWNMIGVPNAAYYLWYDLEVMETDDQGTIINGPVAVSLLPADNDYIDKRIWRWVDGGYTADDSDSFVLKPYEGAWVKAKKKNIVLVFPVSAQSGLSGFSAIYLKTKDWIAGLPDVLTPAYAGHADDDSPPMPMRVTGGEASSVGCFIEVMSAKDGSGGLDQ